MNPVLYKSAKNEKNRVEPYLLADSLWISTGEWNSSLYWVIYLLSSSPMGGKKVLTSRKFCK